MAARLRIEFVSLGSSVRLGRIDPTIIMNIYGATALDVSSTATSSGSRPTTPAFGSSTSGYAILRGLDNPIVVAWGDNPTAVDTPTGTPNDGKRINPGEEVAIYVTTGTKFSAIQVS